MSGYKNRGVFMNELNFLIKQCSDDICALEKIYYENKRKVFAFAYSKLLDFRDAEDAMQETFVRLPKASKNFNVCENGLTFILAITKNITKEMLRKKVKINNNETLLDDNIASYDNFIDNVIISQCLNILSIKQREVITLHIYDNLTFREISQLLHAPQSTIKSRFQKALTILKLKLGDDFDA